MQLNDSGRGYLILGKYTDLVTEVTFAILVLCAFCAWVFAAMVWAGVG